jgi:hypothetical protein
VLCGSKRARPKKTFRGRCCCIEMSANGPHFHRVADSPDAFLSIGLGEDGGKIVAIVSMGGMQHVRGT